MTPEIALHPLLGRDKAKWPQLGSRFKPRLRSTALAIQAGIKLNGLDLDHDPNQD